MRVAILYEDRRGQRNEFGLHSFVCQCVIDRAKLTKPLHSVQASMIQGIPVKGNGNVRKRCQQDLRRLADRNRRIFAVYDEDKSARLANLSGDCCRPLICKQLAMDCEPAEKLEILLLRWNIESAIEKIRDSGLTSLLSTTFADALSKKHLARDRVFGHCAHNLSAEERVQLLKRLPDIDRLVSKVAECMEPENTVE